ncbi:MAG: membrane-bound hydrogenase subunit alpha [Halobacteriales archaeon]|jgi:membrane-bound hydrogenase subunit alpha
MSGESDERIPVGPQHPSLKEPANFMLDVDGEEITGADLSLSYNHRGMEEAAQRKDYLKNIYLIERICGICSHSHTTAYVKGVEELMDVEVPDRARYIRTLIGELERLHSHLLWLGVGGHEMGFDTLWHYTWRDRELVLDSLEELTGNRVHYAINTLGGVREDVDDDQFPGLRENLAQIRERAEYYREVVPEEETVVMRCEGVGTISRERASELCAVGPTARASGVPTDVRQDDPYAAYDEVDFDVVTHEDGDLLARVLVRLEEIVQSCDIVEQVLDEMPDGDLKGSPRPTHTLPNMVEEGEAISRYEAPRGELIHYIESDGSDMPERVKVRAPTLANWLTVVEGLKGSYIADTPMIVAGIDPCISCTSRIGVEMSDDAAVSIDGGDEKLTLDELSDYAKDWYGQEVN